MVFPETILSRQNPSSRTRALAAACVASLLLCAACKSDYPASGQQKLANDAGASRQVKVARVAEIPVGASVAVTGTLAAQDEATLSVKVPGRLGAVGVDLGSVIRRGQVVAQVEQQDY
jgi:membrane fusion protein, multidrug efflux system